MGNRDISGGVSVKQLQLFKPVSLIAVGKIGRLGEMVEVSIPYPFVIYSKPGVKKDA